MDAHARVCAFVAKWLGREAATCVPCPSGQPIARSAAVGQALQLALGVAPTVGIAGALDDGPCRVHKGGLSDSRVAGGVKH